MQSSTEFRSSFIAAKMLLLGALIFFIPNASMSKDMDISPDKLVEKMRGISMRWKATGKSDGKVESEEKVKAEILQGLSKGGASSIPVLQKALNDKSVEMRRNVCLVLFYLGSGFNKLPELDTSPALANLIKATGDSDGLVKAWAAQALGAMGEKASPAVPSLIILLDDNDEGVRIQAASALGAIGPKADVALPALKETLKDPSKDVSSFAKRAIDAISTKSTESKK